MNDETQTLQNAFTIYITSYQPTGPVLAIAEILAGDNPTKQDIENVLDKLDKRKLSYYRKEMAGLVFYYIDLCLRDHGLSRAEMVNVRRLKILFNIREGELYDCDKKQISELLNIQLARILDDRKVDPAEALYEVELQKVFDLSYDQYIELSKPVAQKILNELTDRIMSDGVVTEVEKGQLMRQIQNLNRSYILTATQSDILS